MRDTLPIELLSKSLLPNNVKYHMYTKCTDNVTHTALKSKCFLGK